MNHKAVDTAKKGQSIALKVRALRLQNPKKKKLQISI